MFQDPAHGGGGDQVAAGDHFPDAGEAAGVLLGQDPEQAGGDVQAGDALLDDQPGQFRDAQLALRCDDGPSAVQQRHPEGVGRGVERVGGQQQHPLARTGPEHRVRHELQDVAVGHRDPLGTPRRTRGVHHIGELLRPGRHPGVGGRQAGRLLVVVDQQHGVGGGQAAVAHGGVGQQDRCAGLVEDPLHPLQRRAAVQGEVERPGLQHRQQRRHQVHRALHQHRHRRLGTHPQTQQPVRQPVRPLVQLPVRQLPPRAPHRHRVRGPQHLSRESRLHRTRTQPPTRHHPSPRLQQPHPLVRIDHVDLTDRPCRISSNGFQDTYEAGEQPLHGLPVEQVCGVRDICPHGPGKTLIGVLHQEVQRQVELRRLLLPDDLLGCQAGQVQGIALAGLKVEQDLEQRVAGQ